MIPDLGKYAGTVLGAYGATFVLIGALVAMSFLRNSRIRRALARVERETGGGS